MIVTEDKISNKIYFNSNSNVQAFVWRVQGKTMTEMNMKNVSEMVVLV